MRELKVLCSGDIHLFDREIGASIGYPEESTRNLKKLLNYYQNDESLDIHILGGDIQHGIPEDIRLMSLWRSILIEMRDEIYERLKKNNLFKDIHVYDKKGNELDIESGDVSCLFSVKGNHDYNRRATRETSFTFFDDLVEANIISVPHRIVYNKTEIHFYNSEDWKHPRQRSEGIESLIGIYHDPIMQPGRINSFMGKMINPEEEKIFADVDLAILNDIHMQLPPYKVTTVRDDGLGQETDVITHGSIGRTSFNESHKRDFALLTEILITPDNYLEYELRELELLPYKDLFDYEKVIKVKKRENMFAQFSLEIEKVDKVKSDPRDEIRAMDIEDDIKNKCLELLDEVINDN